jgi:hypothetical protein
VQLELLNRFCFRFHTLSKPQETEAGEFRVIRRLCKALSGRREAAGLIPNCAKSFVTRGGAERGSEGYVAPKVGLPWLEWIK